MEGLVGSSGFRGIALEEVTPSFCLALGKAISSLHPGCHAVGHDVRFSSPLLSTALAIGLNSCGSDVKYLGLAPTPAVAFYSRGNSGGAMVTASHNPPEYNGVKLFDPRGASISQSAYLKISAAARLGNVKACAPLGGIRQGEGIIDYIDAVAGAFRSRRGWKVGLDPGNGSAALTADIIYKRAGINAQSINIAPDGSFPGRGPEPCEGALGGLKDLVRSRGLDIGFAFDGDGDRLAAVDERGQYIEPDTALAFALSRTLKGGKGTVVINVDTSAAVDFVVEAAGGRVVRSKVGDPHILETMVRRRAVSGGETCGAWIFPSISLCPDGVLSSMMFLNLLDEAGLKPSGLGSGLPSFTLRRDRVPCPNKAKRSAMAALEAAVRDGYGMAEFLSVDGIRVGFPDKSWVLIRPSGTEPALRITAESQSERRTAALLNEFKRLAKSITEGKP